ncbi:MAG: lytic transglycosylase domain-containing protein [Luteibaculaceae bacterium]
MPKSNRLNPNSFLKIVSIPIGIFVVALLVNSFNVDAQEAQKANENAVTILPVAKSFDIPQTLNFAGEKISTKREDVRESFDRELLVNTYWQSQTLLFIKRSARWFPVIEPILAKHNIPNDFKYLALIESGLMHVVSPAGAAGYWQFLKTTGAEYGLEVNNFVDERYHVEKSTEAAAKYLKKAYQKYGSWTMAAASYNLGMSGLSKRIENQAQTQYIDLALPEETARYVFRIIAIKNILENPAKYGFIVEPSHLYKPFKYRSIEVNYAIENLAEFAIQNKTTYKQLRILNPWIRDLKLPNNSGKTYVIYIPLEEDNN